MQDLATIEQDATSPPPPSGVAAAFLKRALSFHSALSNISNFVPTDPEQGTLRCIGTGTCGRAYELIGTTCVLKKAHCLTEDFRSQLWNDYQMHTKVHDSLRSFGAYNITIPTPNHFFTEDSSFWNKISFIDLASTVPSVGLTSPGRSIGLTSERILPIPQSVQRALIELYCPPRARAAALEAPGNKDCLIRLYLGKRKQQTLAQARVPMFSLRNFGLYLNMIEDLKLPTFYFTRAMAEALAVMHWYAEVDADDVEFVLGSQAHHTTIQSSDVIGHLDMPINTATGAETSDFSFLSPAIRVWVLDFNRVHSITKDKAGIDKAVTAFFRNDPCYPRPDEPKLWSQFKDDYLSFSIKALFLRDKTTAVTFGHLPDAFLKAIEVEHERRCKDSKQRDLRVRQE